jgi:hypothetical protein
MAILVTGGAGYIGCVTVEHLLEKDVRVVVLDDLYRGHRSSIADSLPFYQGSVGDTALVERILREHTVEACTHFAAPCKGLRLLGHCSRRGATVCLFVHVCDLRRARTGLDLRNLPPMAEKSLRLVEANFGTSARKL